MRIEKTLFKKPKFLVDIKKSEYDTLTIAFNSKDTAVLYEKLLQIENTISNLEIEEESMTEEEQELLKKLEAKKNKNEAMAKKNKGN